MLIQSHPARVTSQDRPPVRTGLGVNVWVNNTVTLTDMGIHPTMSDLEIVTFPLHTVCQSLFVIYITGGQYGASIWVLPHENGPEERAGETN